MNDKALLSDKTSLVDDKRIIDIEEITTPESLIKKYPLDKDTESFIDTSRQIISDIINLKDDRLAVIT
jgi:phospho-2-dehydro-3-deoxyheptonate aldolase